ncbi:potassium channel family protein [Uliginosibacterium sp. H1]|uniref:potassium channel family protein n=1 Tax=Uliginosibacterium sp. H1 TaxID=3114757 RepID=UPI002E184A31|nr:potassium channel family protein [Uliginosibacterium sp. H1]
MHTEPSPARTLRRAFLRELWASLHIVWPILWGLLAIMAIIGGLVGWLENWSLGDSLYFAYVSGLTIGYGDLSPTQPATKLLAVSLGFTGILLTALLGAVAVQALSRCKSDFAARA